MQHTVTIETARKLKEAGVEFKNPLFWYEKYGTLIPDNVLDIKDIQITNLYPAPILSELLEVLPKKIEGQSLTMEISIKGEYIFLYTDGGYQMDALYLLIACDPNPCEAAAQLILKLIENKIPLNV